MTVVSYPLNVLGGETWAVGNEMPSSPGRARALVHVTSTYLCFLFGGRGRVRGLLTGIQDTRKLQESTAKGTDGKPQKPQEGQVD